MHADAPSESISVPSEPQRLSMLAKASYAAGDLGLNVYWQGISLFLFFFYTDIMQIPAWWAGFTILVASVWDGITDVVIGGVADRTQTRLGRYRPYLLYAAPVLGLGFVVTFYVPQGLSQSGLIIYALGTHLLLRTLYTLVAIPYSSLSVRLTADSDERAVVAGWRMQAAAAGGLTTAFATPGIVQFFSEWSAGNPQLGWTYAALAMAITATVFTWLCFLGTRESTTATPASTQSILDDFRTAGRMLKRNGPLLRVFLCIIAASLCLSMLGKTMIYWFKYAVGNEQASGPALAIIPLVLIVLAPIWARLAMRWSKRRVWMAGSTIALLGFVVFFFLPMRNAGAVYAAVSWIAIGYSSFAVMFWAMLPDTVEYDHWISGERHEAKVFGFASFAQKAALGANAFVLGVLLDAIGFVPNAVQSEATLLGLKATMSLIPALGAAVTLLLLYGYTIDAKLHGQIRQDLKMRQDQQDN